MSADKVQEAVNATTDAIARSFNAAAKEGSGFVDLTPEFDALIAVVREDERERLEAFIRGSGIQYAETIFDWTKMRREQGNA